MSTITVSKESYEARLKEVERMGEDLLVTFRHWRERNKNDEIIPKGGITTCVIFRDDGDKLTRVAGGHTRCHSRENFCKRVGRMIALGRALEELG